MKKQETLGVEVDPISGLSGVEKDTYIKITGQKYAYKAMNVVKGDGWISFDRFNTKSGRIEGHMEFPMTSVESIETR